MEVANPIYDVVFKYLMEDDRVAKTIIGAITGFDVLELELRPTEYSSEGEQLQNFTVYRLDFAARVKTPDGSRLVLIEIQKAKFPTDIMRFRRYLGEQYANPTNVEFIEEPSGRKRKVADPIFSIYFLGHRLANTDAPIVRVKRSCTDASTGESLNDREEFIESLTHDSVVIQIPELREKRRNKLEALLSVFDQQLKVTPDGHIINIDEVDYPDEFSFVIRRLLQANSEPEIRKKMTIEDEVISELEERERFIAELGEKATEALIGKAKAEAERRQVEDEKKQVEDEKKQVEDEKKQVEDEKKQVEDRLAKAEEEKSEGFEKAVKIMSEKMNISLDQARELLR